MSNEWASPEYARAYLARLDDIAHRVEGEATLLAEIPKDVTRVLDLGCGNGHLLSLVLAGCPRARGVGLDLSTTMLDQAQRRWAGDKRVELVQHNLDETLPELGTFDCIVSSFAIHHCKDSRKRELYAEVFSRLEAGAIFGNLEHVASPDSHIHDRFVQQMKMRPEDEDPSNKLLDVQTQLRWLKEIGFEHVDCYWKWRELALLIGVKPTAKTNVQDLSIDENPNPAEVSWLDDQLTVFNACQVGRDDFQPMNLVIRKNGNVIAGLKAVTGWEWLYVQVLWVHESVRRTGLGSQLLRRAEQNARQLGCTGACLSSFSFQAPEFYERHGYATFGQIDNYPAGNTMFFLSKAFHDSAAARRL